MKIKIYAISVCFIMLLSAMILPVSSVEALDDPVTFEFELVKGWNVISIPVEHELNASDLALIIDNCTDISKWNSSSQSYEGYLIQMSEQDFEIEPGMGLYVHVNNETSFNLTGELVQNIELELLPGYNLIGWHKQESVPASILFESIDNCTKIMYEKGTEPEKYVYDGVENVTDFIIEQGMGFFVDVDNLSIYDFSVPEKESFIIEDLRIGFNDIATPYSTKITEVVFINDTSEFSYIEALNEGILKSNFYKSVDGDLVPVTNVEEELKPGLGYRINVSQQVDIKFKGYPEDSELEIDVNEGINFLGWIHPEVVNAEQICRSIDGVFVVSILNFSLPGDNQIEYQIHGIHTLEDNFDIKKGDGFWVSVTKNSVWGGFANLSNVPPFPNCQTIPSDGKEMIVPSFEEADVDDNGEVNQSDYNLINENIGEPADDLITKACDIDNDGIVSLTDANLVLHYFSGEINLYAHVADIDDEELDVDFYFENDTFIAQRTGVQSDSRCQVPIEIEKNVEYGWYVIIDDGNSQTKSDIFNFILSEGYVLDLLIVGNGAVLDTPALDYYPNGTIVNLEAQSTLGGWKFDHYEIDGLEITDNPIDVIMDSDKLIKAVFVEDIVDPVLEVLPKMFNTKNLELDVKNIGGDDLSDIDLEYTISGGFLNLLNKTESFSIESINSSEQITITGSENLMGLGPVDLKFSVKIDSEEIFKMDYQGFIIGKIIFIQRPFSIL